MPSSWPTAKTSGTRLSLQDVPGYTGYRDKEKRRDADKQVRERLAAAFAADADRVERVARALADARSLREIGPVDDLATTIRHLVDRISTATYGYGGIFGDRSVDQAALDQLRIFDESLLASVSQLDEPIAELERAHAAGEPTAEAAKAATDAVRAVLRRFDERRAVLTSGTAASQTVMTDALAVLDSPETQALATQSPAAFDLNDRDALAVMGDDFVVDSRIELEGSLGTYRLFRLSAEPERWLLAPKKPDGAFLLLAATADEFAELPQPHVGAESFTVDLSGIAVATVAGTGGVSSPATVGVKMLSTAEGRRGLVIDWGNRKQALLGSDVHSDDIEIFGSGRASG